MKTSILNSLIFLFSLTLSAQNERIKVDSITYEDDTDIELIINGETKDFLILTKPQLKDINNSERWFKIDDDKIKLYKVYYIRPYKTKEVFELRIWINETTHIITIERNDNE